MKYDRLMIRFGELSTKGKNKKDFIFCLFENVRHALKKDFPNCFIELKYDHLYVLLNDEPYLEVLKRLQDISGIHSISLVQKVAKDIKAIEDATLEAIKEEEGKTFKVAAKRADKKFEIHSDDIVRKVAGNILRNTDLKVDVHNPDIMLKVEIREEAAYIYCKTYEGLGGYPLGVGGKIMMMLSGGIDSPVAAYLLMRRGLKIECIHFASPPYTKEGVIYKLEDLLKKLNRYQPEIRLNIIPFTKLQEEIYKHAPESYAITIMRRMMYRLAERLSRRRNCHAFANGESIGQVASQTLNSMDVINQVTNMPVIRPLATTDKLEIIKIAQKIDTYDISIRPFEDCCTIFAPKNPKTMPHYQEVLKIEESFDYQSLIDEAVKNVEVRVIKDEDDLF